MAEGGLDPTSRKPKGKVQQICRYYVHGACERGENCKFLHDRTGTAPANNVCKFYQNGLCSYGSRCRYDHVKPSQTTKHSEVTPKKNSRHHSEPPKHHQRGHQNGDNWGSSMVTLKKGGGGTTVASKEPFNHGQEKYRKNWHKAQDFVPGQKTHAGASYAKAALPPNVDEKDNMAGPNEYLPSHQATDEDLLCPYFAHGHCPFEGDCVYIHGDICDICLFPRLHPTDTAQREQHNKECLKEMDKDMEHSFAIQESQDKECCICLELVLEKAEKEAAGASKASIKTCQYFKLRPGDYFTQMFVRSEWGQESRMERGSLPRTDEHKIQVNFSYLVKELDVKYIIHDLFEQMLIDINEKEEIGSISRFDDRADKFLNYLLRSGGSDGYQKFLDCLRKNQYGHIVDKLESTEPEPAHDTEPCPWFDSVDERIKQHVILDVDASRFSLCIGNGWENLLRELGIGQADIEMEKQSTRDAVSCLCRLLIRWKQRKSKAATVQALVQAMKELDGSLTVDWEKFHKAVGKISI